MLQNSVRLLGRPQLALGPEVLLFLQDKRYLLLAYLAYSGDWMSREHLAYLFWSESDTTTARKNLRHLLARVRALEWQPALETEREHLRWPVATDVAAFEQACTQSDWATALQTFGGELLQGFSADDAPEFAAWLETEREHLTQRWRGAAFRQSGVLESRGQTAQSLELLGTLLEFNPLDEEALEYYMQTAARSGETRPALRAYERFTALLKQELGLPPTLGLERLAESIRQKNQSRVRLPGIEPTPPRPAPHPPIVPDVPLASTPFVGRDLELAEIAEVLHQPECRLLTLCGPGGVGKSRLALQTALEQAAHFPDGVYFVALDSVEVPEQIPLRIAESLKLALKGADSPLSQLERSMGERTLLLVLDNYEHLLEGAGIASRLLEACPNLHLLVTSRERLNLRAEWVIQVRGLALPEGQMSLPEAQHYDAPRLFVLRVQQVRPDFVLNDQNLPQVLEVCRRVEGFPLALELAAAWARVLPLEEIVREIGNPAFMVSQSRDTEPRHRSMEAVFAHSWQLLTPAEQTALRRLSVFFGGFRTEAVKQVSAAPLPVLAALVDKSLLRLTPSGRYDRHALLYQYMQQKLEQHPAEAQETRSQHSQYYLRFLSRALGEIRGPNSKPMLEALEEELGNLRLAWSWALQAGRYQAIKEGSEALMRFFDARGRYLEGIEMFEEARQVLDQGNPQHHAALGTVLVFLGKFQQRLRQQDTAEQTTRRGLDLLRALPIPEPEPLIWGLGTLGTVANTRGQNQDALAYRLEALEKAKEIANPRLIAVCSGWVAISEDSLGNYPAAIRHYRKAIFLFKQQGNCIGTLYNTSDLGALLMDLGRFEEALPLLQEALEACRASGELVIQGETLMSLSRCYLKLGQPEQAWGCAEEALRLAAQHPQQYDEVRLYALLSQVAVTQGQLAQAEGFFLQALGLAWQEQQISEALEVLCGWAVMLGADSLEAPKILRLVAEHPQAFSADREKARSLLSTVFEGEGWTLEGAVEYFLYR
ncbi:tetratricopeptide repeat protein [Meiothermus sp.]|uniref:AfsR/SARP family transcriptional regulator n=1 Tax=Meiothermus sp. TaxID=1955249 RepID=UPI0021DEA164|nr:tetratricopeptide repeat protein [Meiothermus sp.]GIW25834.1 MAG: transcriptional activator [Meiothermus sp.]